MKGLRGTIRPSKRFQSILVRLIRAGKSKKRVYVVKVFCPKNILLTAELKQLRKLIIS